MGVLDGLQPANVFHYFEEISQIPHGSGNVKQISDYLCAFAEQRNLFFIQDKSGNVIIVKEAAPGREKEEPFVLQAHIDMVAVAAQDCCIDLKKDPLRLKIDGGEIYAEGTSLGGDDGIGVAYCLALLDAQDIRTPRLEVILTADEETGMEGAKKIDLSMLRGRRMINLDQEEEGIFVTSCAGGARVEVHIPLEREQAAQEEQLIEIAVTGLLGGHSGIEINKGRGNANCLLGQALRAVGEKCRIRLVQMNGGVADNAIAREAAAVIAVREADIPAVEQILQAQEQKLKGQVAAEETQAGISSRRVSAEKGLTAASEASTKRALACLGALPNGVVAMSREVEGLVETSLNLGQMTSDGRGLHLQYAVRSSVDREKEILCERMLKTAEEMGADALIRNSYPGWAYWKDSPLRKRMVQIYAKMYGKPPVLEAIHAGLECGILAGKLEGLDCISIGPDLSDVHTAKERMSIASVGSVWRYLLEVLARDVEA